jgi:hypothetical protein
MTPGVPARRCGCPWQQSEGYGRLGAALGWEERMQRRRPERRRAAEVQEPPGGGPPQRAGGQPLGSKAQPRRAEGKEWLG